MDPPVKIINDELICQKWNHNQRVILVKMEKQVPFEDIFLCEKCLENYQYIVQGTPLSTAIQMIKEQKDEQLNTNFQNLQQFQSKIRDLQSKILGLLNESLHITQLWIDDYRNEPIDLLGEFKKYYKQENITKNNKSYSVKLNGIFEKIIDLTDFLNCQKLLKEITETKQPPKPPIKPKRQFSFVSEVRFTDSKNQEEWSKGMAFNGQGTILAAGCNSDIKLWKFNNGKMNEQNKLTGHTGTVNCIIFSKTQNWFASGSADSTIRSWKEQNNQWVSNQPIKKHSNEIMGLILNYKENEILSCSFDKSILSWKVTSNQLEFDYQLESKHTSQVLSISLNESETYLVSCSLDKTIILWSRDQNNKWKYQQTLINNDYGYRVSFINDNEIAWQQCHKGIMHIYQVEKGNITRKPERNIQFSEQNNDTYLFPTIVNQERQVVIQKYNKDVFLLQRPSNDSSLIMQRRVECLNAYNFGTLTVDGTWLVVWLFDAKQFRIYNIKY